MNDPRSTLPLDLAPAQERAQALQDAAAMLRSGRLPDAGACRLIAAAMAALLARGEVLDPRKGTSRLGTARGSRIAVRDETLRTIAGTLQARSQTERLSQLRAMVSVGSSDPRIWRALEDAGRLSDRQLRRILAN